MTIFQQIAKIIKFLTTKASQGTTILFSMYLLVYKIIQCLCLIVI